MTVEFAAFYGDAPLTCSDESAERLTDLRFYVHDVAVADAQGEWHAFKMTPMSPWQTADVALLDLEDGSGACRGGSSFLRTVIEGETSAQEISGLRFTVGVPFELNHRDPVRADSPLNQSVMHWHWQGGYKFMRAGLETSEGGAWFHLGSIECQGTVGAIEGCNYPNRVAVQLDQFNPETDKVTVHMDALFAGVTLDDATPTGCMASRLESSCASLLTNLSLLGRQDDTRSDAPVFQHAARR